MIQKNLKNMKKKSFLHTEGEGLHVIYRANAKGQAKAGAIYTSSFFLSIFVYAYTTSFAISFSLLIAKVHEANVDTL
jgi:hypothetical protein